MSTSVGNPSCMFRYQCTEINGLLQDHTVRLKERVITESEVGEPMIARLIPEAQTRLEVGQREIYNNINLATRRMLCHCPLFLGPYPQDSLWLHCEATQHSLLPPEQMHVVTHRGRSLPTGHSGPTKIPFKIYESANTLV